MQGKEFEIKLKEKKPGDLSDELRTALGMPVGPVRILKYYTCVEKCSKSILVVYEV